jgi:hypothetical protein
MYYNTFCALIRVVSLDLRDTNMRESILVEVRIDMVLTRLGSEKFITNVWNSLWHCKKYDINYCERILCIN